MELSENTEKSISLLGEVMISFNCTYIIDSAIISIVLTFNEEKKDITINNFTSKEIIAQISFKDLYGVKILESDNPENSSIKISYMPKVIKKTFNIRGIFCCDYYKINKIRENKSFIFKLQKMNFLEGVVDIFKRIVFFNSSNDKFRLESRKILLYINPFGGQGKSLSIYNQIKEIFGIIIK